MSEPAVAPRLSQHLEMALACLLLVVVAFLALSPLLGAGFVDYDDQVYVTSNARVQKGLTWAGVKWAFTNLDFGFYYPLTWLSHMLDCQLYGLKAWGHHLTSILIHIANATLLFVFLRRATGALWRSWVVAALFALHPLHVESVAWIAERKDVLSTFFLFLAFLAYARYVRKPGLGRMATVFLLLLAGLMAKSMLVTAPVLLLLLDVWPFRRLGNEGAGAVVAQEGDSSAWVRSWRGLVLEKVPLFLLAMVFGVLTVYAQNLGGAVNTLRVVPLGLRVETALVGYGTYLVKMVAPVNLAVLYPLPIHGWPLLRLITSVLLLLAVTALVWYLHRGRPYLLVGWLWFLTAVAPVSGILQVGQQAYADRYTYVSLIGVFIMIVWTAGDFLERRRTTLPAAVAGVALLSVSLGAASWHQCGYWRDGVTLFTHSIKVGGPNETMLGSLGFSLIEEGRASEAIPLLKQATELNARSVTAWGNLGNAFRDVGKLEPAAACYGRVLALDPKDFKALHNLGAVQEKMGHLDDALESYQRQALLQPESGAALVDVGRLLAKAGRMGEAMDALQRAVRLAPGDPRAHYYLAAVMDRLGRTQEAETEWRRALDAALREGNGVLAREIEAGMKRSAELRSAP